MIDQTLNDRYHVTALIGEGAMGEVYRATDTQTGEEVAVKVITQKLAFDDEMLARFRREGEALRHLRHSNIVAFVDMFTVGKQQAIVMEYVAGGSLHNLVKQGPLPIDQAVRITLELSDALSRAHLLNVIHRDIKPENVLMAADGTPKLTDFGVARLVGDTGHLTSTGTQLGTPYYMSPEAWEGRRLDEQADIWSLGIVLFEMLAGQLPFTGDTLAAVMNRILTTAPPDLRSLRADVPPALVKIIQHMLTRDRAKRYGSMREVALDLERVRKDLASRAAAPPAQAKKEAAKPPGPKPTPPPESKPATKPPTPKPAPTPPAAKPAAPPSAPRPAPVPAAPPPAPAEAPTVLGPAAETPTIVTPAEATPTLLASTLAASEAPERGIVDEAATILPPTGEVATLSAAPAAPEPAEERPARRVSPLVIGAGVLALLVVAGIVVGIATRSAPRGNLSGVTQTAAFQPGGMQTAPAVALVPTQMPEPSETPVPAANPPPTVAATAVPAAAAVGGKWCSGVHIVFFPGGTEGEEFAGSVYNGARQAEADLGPRVDYVWSDWDNQKMLQQFSESAATRPDGIAVMGHPGDQAFDPLIDDAESKGIIVTSQNTALDTAEAKYAAKGFGYVGAELYQAGHDLGTEAIKRFNLHKGDRALVWGLSSSLRTHGAKDALAQAGLTVDYLEIDATTAKDPASGGPAFSAYVASHPDVKLVITDHGGLTAAAQTYLTAAGKKPGDIKVAGFDLSRATIPAIKGGWTNLVFDQQAWLQGYLPILQICLTKVYGFSGLHINTGTGFVDKSNVDVVAPSNSAPAAAGGKWCSGVHSVFFPGGPQGGVFAVNVYNGAVQAAADLGPQVDYVWSDWDPQKMLQQFSESAATKPDGIAVMGHPGDTAFDPLIDDAEGKGIIVTSGNTTLDLAEAKYAAKGFGYVGAELYAAGQSLGDEAVKRFNLHKGDRALVWGLLSQPTRGLRTKGVMDALTKAGLTVDYIEIDSATNADPTQGGATFTAYAALHPDVKLVVTDHGGLTATAQTYLTAAGKKPGDIKVAGFDLVPASIAAIKGGWTGLVIDQQEWLQGYLPVLQICLTKVHGFSGLHINTGAGFVDASNVDTVAPLADKNIR